MFGKFVVFWSLLTAFCASFSHCFNPFMDQDLHAIEWTGPTSLEQPVDENVLIIQTSSHEKYKCLLPHSKDSADDSKKPYDGPSPVELMKMLFVKSSCSYRIESYWTYELCHGRYLRQYHENKELSVKKAPLQEYFLGFAEGQKKAKEPTDVTPKETVIDEEEKKPEINQVKIKKIDGVDLPYFEVNMTDGTECDLTKKPRKSRLMYMCQPDGRGEIFEFKESSTCEYEIIVLTSVLCANPLFKPKNPPVSKISCHALDGSPYKPTVLKKWNEEEKSKKPIHHPHVIQDNGEEEEEEEEEKMVDSTPVKSTTTKTIKVSVKEKDTTLGVTTDKQILRSFLTGSQCLQGGGGWWKHEVCFGNKVRQFHEDQKSKTEITLGKWIEHNHLLWVTAKPTRKPKEKGKRTSVNLMFTEGDVCDITGKKRVVEVKLKCVQNIEQPHSVSIYLLEPKTCEYIMGVESPLFCSILDMADENGLFNDINL